MAARFAGSFHWAGYLLGFALGGFFDGILLHQILQWHHLLSLVEGAGGTGRQILFDGLCHAAMYLVAALGLVLLWRSRTDFAAPGAGRLAGANALIGFGIWNILDGVLSHWILAIHRIRLDASNPLAWDLIWFVTFGLIPVAAGLLSRDRARSKDAATNGRSAILGLAAATLVGGAWAAQPPVDADSAIVLFRPGISDGDALNAIGAAGARLLWRSDGVWAVAWTQRRDAARLYGDGAMLISTSMAGGGCLAWSRA